MTKVLRDNDRWVRSMTSGERRFADRLESLLEDDYFCWFEVPVGDKRRYTDFILLHPARGLLFLEVKDWRIEQIVDVNHDYVYLQDSNGPQPKQHPIDQARDCALSCINQLQSDSRMVAQSGKNKGKLLCPWGFGAVLPNITRAQLNQAMREDVDDRLFPKRLTICKDEMLPSTDAEAFQEKLWAIYTYRFGRTLTLPEVERLRWHIFPNVRINQEGYQTADLFSDTQSVDLNVPDIVKVLDMQQEQLARSLGDGHRVIHGVAGSGKTLILGYRCHYLAQAMKQPILVLCFNTTLKQKLRSFLKAKGIQNQVHIYHFHEWCKLQLQTYHVDLLKSPDKKVFEQQVTSVIAGVDKGFIPREQYGAVLIDEGHDFDAQWLSLIVQMVSSETESLLLLYDDTQSIYKKKSGLDFSLSSVGIQARGRTTVLKMNYRNTREILQFAYDFVKEFVSAMDADDDHIPILKPEAAGKGGPRPAFYAYKSMDEEMASAAKILRYWKKQGIAWRNMAVIFPLNWYGKKLEKKLRDEGFPCISKRDYQPGQDAISVLTRHSSKGLEFSHVLMVGVGCLKDDEDQLASESKLLYVGMTRAKEALVVTAHKENSYTRSLQALA